MASHEVLARAAVILLDAFGPARVIDETIAFAGPPPPAATLNAAIAEAGKALLREHSGRKRDEAASAGCVWQGQTVPTDEASRAAVAQAIQSIDLGIAAAPINWRLPSGFVPLSRADLVSLAAAMAANVQACFELQAQLLDQIALGQITAEAQIDAAGWPA
jgi:hypothetical protein